MRGGKPTVPENITGTLTSSDYNSAHTGKFTKNIDAALYLGKAARIYQQLMSSEAAILS
jgi:hypothetical protein